MDQSVKSYLIEAHNRVRAHYHKILEADGLTQPERERIERNLAQVEAELETIRRGGALSMQPAA